MAKMLKFDEKLFFEKLFYTRLITYGAPKEAYCPPELRKHTLNQPRLADIPKQPPPFLTFRKFEILKLCIKIGMW